VPRLVLAFSWRGVSIFGWLTNTSSVIFFTECRKFLGKLGLPSLLTPWTCPKP